MPVAIITRYIGPSNTRGARIVADAGDRRRVTIGYPHEFSGAECHFQAVKKLCAKFDWHGSFVAGATDTGYAFCFEADRQYSRENPRQFSEHKQTRYHTDES